MRKRSEVQRPVETPPREISSTRVELPDNPKSNPEVAKLSDGLNRELHPERYEFESANSRGVTALRDDFDQIVESVFVEDIGKTWRFLKGKLKVGDGRSDHGSLNRALDEASDDAYEAHRVYVTAKVAREEWERDNDIAFGAMWSEATRSLQEEKDSKLRSKQVTDADVRARCATLFPDEWRSQENRRGRVKATEDSLKQMAEVFMSRVASIQTMMKRFR